MPVALNQVSQMFGQANRIQQVQAEKAASKIGNNQAEESTVKGAEQLYESLFQEAREKTPANGQKLQDLFQSLSPKEAMELTQFLKAAQKGYKNTASDEGQDKSRSERQSLFQPQTQSRRFVRPELQKAHDSVHQIQSEAQRMVSNMMGSPNSLFGDAIRALGPGATFEDVLMHIMMKIAKKEEKRVLEKMRVLERNKTGVQGQINNGARKLGGIAAGALGGALGGYMGGATGGATGAALGQDLGERAMHSYGYDNSPESRQLEFEKLKHMMQKLSEMMTCISNIMAATHKTNQNAIGNMRA